jgi:hypothetical protein
MMASGHAGMAFRRDVKLLFNRQGGRRRERGGNVVRTFCAPEENFDTALRPGTDFRTLVTPSVQHFGPRYENLFCPERSVIM